MDIPDYNDVPEDSPMHAFLTKHMSSGTPGNLISHIDRTSLKKKISIFSLYAFLNVLVLGLIYYRIRSGGTKYLPILLPGGMGLMDRPGAKPSLNMSELFWTSVQILVDSMIATTVWPFLQRFFTGPLWYRLRYGFREAEIIIRRPSTKGHNDFMAVPDAQKIDYYNAQLSKACAKSLVNEETGILTNVNMFELDYDAMAEACTKASTGEIPIGNWELSSWERKVGDAEHFVVWKIWTDPEWFARRLHRRMTVILDARLAALNRPELIQELDNSQPTSQEGFKTVFRNHGIDYIKFMQDITLEAEGMKRT